MVTIKWLLGSKNDLKEIFDYINQDSPKYAKYQILSIKSKIDLLKNQPLMGKVVAEFDDINIREIVHGNYRIVYKVLEDNIIHILLIHHSSRHFPRM